MSSQPYRLVWRPERGGYIQYLELPKPLTPPAGSLGAAVASLPGAKLVHFDPAAPACECPECQIFHEETRRIMRGSDPDGPPPTGIMGAG